MVGYVPIHNEVLPMRVMPWSDKRMQAVYDVEGYSMQVLPAGGTSVALAEAIVARTVCHQDRVRKSLVATSVYHVSLYSGQPGTEVPVVVIKQPKNNKVEPTAPIIFMDAKSHTSLGLDTFHEEIDDDWMYVELGKASPSELLHFREMAGAALIGHMAQFFRLHYFPTDQPLTFDHETLLEAWGEQATAYFDELERNLRRK